MTTFKRSSSFALERSWFYSRMKFIKTMCTLMEPSFTRVRKSSGTWERNTAIFSLSLFILVQKDILESKMYNVDICRCISIGSAMWSLTNVGVKQCYLLIYLFFHLFFFLFCRCGLRGGYIELLGLSDQVKFRIKTYLSARSCPSTIGQVRK